MDTNITPLSKELQKPTWSRASLKKLDIDELKGHILFAHNISYEVMATLFYTLRLKFKDNEAFGVCCNELRSDGVDIDQQGINRLIHAGWFIEHNKISDIKKAGLKKDFINQLAAPKNRDVSDAITSEIRSLSSEQKKALTSEKVREMISIAKAKLKQDDDSVVATIEKQPEHKVIEGEVIRETSIPTAPVVAPSTDVAQQAVSRLMQSIIEEETLPETLAVTLAEKDLRMALIKEERPQSVISRRRELLLELSQMDNSGVSDEEILEDYELLDRSYRRNDLKMSEAHNNKRNEYSRRIYGK